MRSETFFTLEDLVYLGKIELGEILDSLKFCGECLDLWVSIAHQLLDNCQRLLSLVKLSPEISCFRESLTGVNNTPGSLDLPTVKSLLGLVEPIVQLL